MKARAVEMIRQDCREALAGETGALSALKGGTVLIAGGTGFLGTWLAETLACLNDDFNFDLHVILLARHVETFRAARAHLALRRDVELLARDVRDVIELPREVNWVVHAAASPDNRLHASNPVETMSVIASGTQNLIRALDRAAALERFLYLSSGLVYGSQPWEVERLREDYGGAPPCGSAPASYAEAKRFAETYCAAARTQQRLPAVIARPFTFMGPYQSLETPWAVNNFLRDALTGNAIRVLGDGQTLRSVLYGSDAAVALLKMLVAGQVGAAYNLGSPDGATLERIAHAIADCFEPKPEIRLNASGSGAHKRTLFLPDMSLAARTLGFKVKVPLEKAVARTVDWNRELAGVGQSA